MKRVYNNYLLVGIFTILIGGTAILLLLKMSGRNEATESYYSYFKNVTGLSYGNPVYYEGYRVGQVESITPEFQNGNLKFKTRYSVIQGWKIPQDSVTKIESSGLLSDMSLAIYAGKSNQYFAPESEIKGEAAEDIMATVSNLASDFERLNDEKITPLLDLVYERTDKLTKSLETQIPEVLGSIDNLVKDINKLVNTAETLLDEDNVEKIDSMIANLNQLSEEVKSLGSWLETSVDKVNQLLESGDKMVNNSDNKVAQILDVAHKMVQSFAVKADTISNEIESASMNLNEATEIIRRNPSQLIFEKKSKIAYEEL